MLEVPQNLLVFLLIDLKDTFLNITFPFFSQHKKFEVFLYFEKKKISLEITEREAFPRSVATSNAGLAIAP